MSKNFSDTLDNKYKMEELMARPENAGVKALYEYLSNLSELHGQDYKPSMDFLVSEMEKEIPYIAEKGRSIEKDVQAYFKDKNMRCPIGCKTMDALEYAQYALIASTEPHVKEFVENFKNQRFLSTLGNGRQGGDMMIVNTVKNLEKAGDIETADMIMKAANALAEKSKQAHFPFAKFNKYKNLIESKSLTLEEKDALINSINQPTAAATYQEMYKTDKKKELTDIESEMKDMLDKMDNLRIEAQKSDFAYSEDLNFSLDDYKNILKQDNEAFENYVDSVKTTLPEKMPEAEKESKAFEIIAQRQNERLNEKISGIDKDNKFLQEFEACSREIGQMMPNKKSFKRDELLASYDNDFAKSLKTGEKLRLKIAWMAGNIKEAYVSDNSSLPMDVNRKMQQLHCSMLTSKIQTSVDIMAKCSEKITDIQLAACNKGHGRAFAAEMKVKGLRFIQQSYAKRFNSLTTKKEVVTRKMAEYDKAKAYGQDRENLMFNGFSYLKGNEYKVFNDNEKKLLYDFSLAAHRSFTKDEAHTIVNAYLASEGRFNPNMLAQYKGDNLMEAILTANQIEIADQRQATHKELVGNNKISYNLINETASILGSEKLAGGLTVAQQRFINDKYLLGEAKVDDLRHVATEFYSNPEFSIDDASAHLIRCKLEDRYSNPDFTDAKNEMKAKMVNENDPLEFAGKTASAIGKTMKTTFVNENTNTQYELTVAKNGHQFILREKDLETGEISLTRNTAGIREILAQNTEYGKSIIDSTRNCVATLHNQNLERPIEAIENVKEKAAEIKEAASEKLETAKNNVKNLKDNNGIKRTFNKAKNKVRDMADEIEL